MPRKPWLTLEVVKICDIKNKLYSKWKRDLNNLEIKRSYLKYANGVNVTITEAKEQF